MFCPQNLVFRLQLFMVWSEMIVFGLKMSFLTSKFVFFSTKFCNWSQTPAARVDTVWIDLENMFLFQKSLQFFQLVKKLPDRLKNHNFRPQNIGFVLKLFVFGLQLSNRLKNNCFCLQNLVICLQKNVFCPQNTIFGHQTSRARPIFYL